MADTSRCTGPVLKATDLFFGRTHCRHSLALHDFIFCISTWNYENRVSKHFVIFRSFPCLLGWQMFTVLFAYVVFFCLFCG